MSATVWTSARPSPAPLRPTSATWGRATMSGAPSRAQALSLFRSLLRAARAFPDSTVGASAARRAAAGFREHRASAGSAAAEAYELGAAELQVARRQGVVYALYGGPYRHGLEVAAKR